MNLKYLLTPFVAILILVSCSKNQDYNAVEIKSIPEKEDVSLILILGDGMGIPQITAAYAENQRLHLQDFPYSGLVLTQTADKFVTESGAAATAMLTGLKTNYGYQGMDVNQQPLHNIYQHLKSINYKTAIVTTSFITDATLAALYRHGTDRYDYENIALDYLKNYPDFCVAGGKKHFDERSDGINLLDNLSANGVQLFYENNTIASIQQLPSLGLLYPSRPSYLNDGRTDFLKQSSLKALELFEKENFFLFIEGALIDLGGHDTNINRQIEETLELDEIAGLMLDYAKTKDNVLVVVVSDHESGGLSLLQGEGMNYIPNYALDEHSGNMVAVFAYGPGAEQFTGIMDNTDIYYKLASILKIDQQFK